MFALVLRTQLPAQDVNAALRVPRPIKLYSANTDQCGANRSEVGSAAAERCQTTYRLLRWSGTSTLRLAEDAYIAPDRDHSRHDGYWHSCWCGAAAQCLVARH